MHPTLLFILIKNWTEKWVTLYLPLHTQENALNLICWKRIMNISFRTLPQTVLMLLILLRKSAVNLIKICRNNVIKIDCGTMLGVRLIFIQQIKLTAFFSQLFLCSWMHSHCEYIFKKLLRLYTFLICKYRKRKFDFYEQS